MKIRHPILIKSAGLLIAWTVRAWMSSVRYIYRPLERDFSPRLVGGERFIYAVWHENLLIPAYYYSKSNIWVLISKHADGQMIALACRHLHFPVVAGSATRGGVEAVRKMLRLSNKSHLAITPDGPRGPRRQVKEGLVYLASRTGLPIVPVGFGYQRAWRLGSWDRLALPWPGSAVVSVTGPSIIIPPDLDRDQLEAYRLKVEQAMEQVTAAAERQAAQQGW